MTALVVFAAGVDSHNAVTANIQYGKLDKRELLHREAPGRCDVAE